LGVIPPDYWLLDKKCGVRNYEIDISQNNIHYFENIGYTGYILLSSALLILRWK